MTKVPNLTTVKQWSLCMLGTYAGLRSWQCVAVEHCRDAWGLVVEHVHGWSLVYSGTPGHARPWLLQAMAVPSSFMRPPLSQISLSRQAHVRRSRFMLKLLQYTFSLRSQLDAASASLGLSLWGSRDDILERYIASSICAMNFLIVICRP